MGSIAGRMVFLCIPRIDISSVIQNAGQSDDSQRRSSDYVCEYELTDLANCSPR